MKSAEIREKFLKFFESKGHRIVASSALVPRDDPTLLFTNAGMNQFKDVFLGFDKRPYSRAATSQKCVRAGGKHNDLENVGYTARHHTFFEMLGNFSFGDYFKRDAIHYAWELLTEVFGLPEDKLYVTVYAEDDEAHGIWTRDIGLAPARVIRIGDNKGARYASDNFWMMGDTGPCGPCTEIFYDHGPDIPGGLPGTPEEDGDRYIEIWNNVFMQFNLDEAGVMHPLPRPSVDTGMGLERISAVLQGVHSNYEIDLFQHLIRAAARETSGADMANPSLKVLADHIRACAFLVADGVIPGNEGRGYVLRRIIRRAIRHGYKLGARAAFFHRLVPDLVEEMGTAYPELSAGEKRIAETLKTEEERFFATIENGMAILEAELKGCGFGGGSGDGAGFGDGSGYGGGSGDGAGFGDGSGYGGGSGDGAGFGDGSGFDGEIAFKLHDTYGFPLDLTADVCREYGVPVDTAAFDAAMARQKEQARAAGKFKMAVNLEYSGANTAFHGYETLEASGRILALYREGAPVEQLNEGELGVVVLDDTPFYAESGGQAGDRGELKGAGLFAVEDTQKIQAAVFGHHGVVKTGALTLGATVAARVDADARAATARNHSVTHLMHKALREVLGAHVQQKGSQVDPEKTRFDFAHNAPMSAAEIRAVEENVNAEIIANTAVEAAVMSLEAAQKTGAVMLFGEKYGDSVRVLTIGTSKEFCGGTHVMRTGDIGLFKIVAETGVAAGVRRVEAFTGMNALHYAQEQETRVQTIAAQLKTQPSEAAERVAGLLDTVHVLEKDLARAKSRLAANQGGDLAAQALEVNGIKVLAATLEGVDAPALRDTLDKLKDRLKSAVIVLASVKDGKVNLIAGITANLTGKYKAGELVNFVARQVGGKGGGRPDMAQAGGTEPEKLVEALESVKGWVIKSR
ncbi:MAG: alanine--tRNA ligase [Azoarcus sp.]|jgi:alanyl-tRNA synthetase|nr:alanine--tRNA ligase [Azoarcus sp.]